ncbi:MAG TPA: metal-dependent transcriptional regulator [Bacteroidales bacterium]|nr:metal-dependent transcriptional regulator [Bacteroidales bacterium]
MSTSIENFVKVVYQYEQNQILDTRPGTIARALGISNAAATDMSRKLADKKLLFYEKYQELKLTEGGKKMALHVIRKHRLWEAFLFRVFNLSLHEIHREAEMLEHQTSDFLAEKISAYLGYPEIDPHGEPIPDEHGSMWYRSEQVLLTFAETGRNYEITGLIGSDKEFFDFCTSNNLKIGTKLKVLNQYEKVNMTEIKTGKKKILLNRDIANIIFITQIPPQKGT